FECAWSITPKATPSGGQTHDLNLWVKDGAGTDRTTTGPTLLAGGASIDGENVQRVPDYTRVVGWGADDLHVAKDSTAKSSFGQLTKFVDAEELVDEDSVGKAVDAAIADEAANRPAGKVVLSGSGSVIPFRDFTVGDKLIWQAPP